MTRTEVVAADIVVIGAGAAGLCAAIEATPRSVLIVCPEVTTGSCTELARGGIAAPIAAGDSVTLHVADTLHAAAHSGCASTSRRIISEAQQAIEYLQRSGVRFDSQHGSPSFHLEAGHSLARILHTDGDATGAAIHAALMARAKACPHIQFMNDVTAISLLRGQHGIAGVLALRGNCTPLIIHAAETVLATGGVGQLFATTSNGRYATGDGLAMALQQNAAVAGLEFVQFHPTALRCALDPLPLLTEALRGAGAKLVRDDGVRFMAHVDQRAELASRDIVARAVWQQQQAGHTVLLDATGVFAGEHAAEFPSAHAACMAQGIDPARTAIPITSAAHFHMGGVITDAQGRSNLPGLWACGEVAYTGLHGANRLASNSLLEAVVVGCATGRALAKQRYVHRDYQQNCQQHTRATPAPVNPQRPEWQQLRLLMWAAMGPVRTAAELRIALQNMKALQRNIDPSEITLLQRIHLAEAMAHAALNREESRGAHWRSDFPQRNHQLDGHYALVSAPSTSIANSLVNSLANSLLNPAGTQ